MIAYRRGVRAVLLLVLGCSEPARAPVASPPSSPPAPFVWPKKLDDAACKELAAVHRQTLPRDQEVKISRDGRGRYHGLSIHRVEDRSFTMLVLELFDKPWFPDPRDRTYSAFGEHCVRLVEVNADRVEIEVALQAAHQYDSHRCEMGCCPEGASIAPDGTEECCFCSDVP
jgi:hypothetical protein